MKNDSSLYIMALIVFVIAPLIGLSQDNNIPKLQGISRELYEQRVLDLTKDLGTYIQIVCDKQTDWQDANIAIEEAVNLFVNEDGTIEVSNKNESDLKQRFKIRDYMKRMKVLKYSKIEIEWSQVYFVDSIRLAPDGNYYGVVAIEQKFSGFSDGQLIYNDYTTKHIEIILRPRKVEKDGGITYTWDVLFTMVNVKSTK